MKATITSGTLNTLRIACIIIFILLTRVAAAKDVNGEIIFSDRIEKVTFNVPMSFGKPSVSDMQSRVVYYDSIGKKHILKPENAREIRFKVEDKVHRMISRRFSEGGNLQFQDEFFLYLFEDGFLKLYVFFEVRLSVFSTTTSYYLVQKGDDPLESISQLNFKEEATDYFGSCPKLVNKIESGEFRYRHFPELAQFFNFYCSSDYLD